MIVRGFVKVFLDIVWYKFMPMIMVSVQHIMTVISLDTGMNILCLNSLFTLIVVLFYMIH